MCSAQIENPSILIKPSKQLHAYIKKLEVDVNMPSGVVAIRKNKLANNTRQPIDHKHLLQDEDRDFINELKLGTIDNASSCSKDIDVCEDDRLLNLEDVHWLYNQIKEGNQETGRKVYFHELFEGSEVILPKNTEVPRNPELERRCKILKAQQQNVQYKAMTKNVDCVRQHYPEDTISYQMRQLNKHLIAVGQFIISVAAGFAFGFIGLEVLVGSMDFGFRILLGIICALVVALAELYFLAKKLNEDLNFETNIKANDKVSKIN